MQIGRETKGEVGETRASSGGVEMLGESTRYESPEETDGYGGNEAEEEPEHRYGDPNRRCHGIHVEVHG